MRVFILTSSPTGTAAHHLPYLMEDSRIEVAGVIYNRGIILNKKRHWLSKLKKILRIGIPGAINGIRMRKWFNDQSPYIPVTSVQTVCEENKIPFFTVDAINSEPTRQIIEQMKADLGISLGNSYIGSKIFSIPRFGMINIHHEILPDYQNAQSIIWSVYNRDSSTGYTIHRV